MKREQTPFLIGSEQGVANYHHWLCEYYISLRKLEGAEDG